MPTLDELATIPFNRLMGVEEFKNGFLKELSHDFDIAADISYTNTYQKGSVETEYPSKIKVEVSRGVSMPTYFYPQYDETLDNGYLISGIEFDIRIPGYDTAKEFESLPSGKDTLKLVNDFRIGVENYLSSHPPKPISN